MAIKEKKTRKALLAKLYAEKDLRDSLEDWSEESYKEWLKKEREENGPFEIDEDTDEEIIAWMPDDFDDDGNLREGMKKWQYLLDGKDEPDEEE